MGVAPRYGGKLKLLKTSVSLPQYIIDDLRRLARLRGMILYQKLLRELVSEKGTTPFLYFLYHAFKAPRKYLFYDHVCYLQNP